MSRTMVRISRRSASGLRKQLQCRFRIAEDRSQRLRQLVGKGARQLAEHGGAAEMHELLLLRAFLGFGLLAIGDVGPHQYRAALGTAQRLDGDFEPDDAAGRVRSVFESMMQRPAGDHFVGTGAEPGGEGVALRARFEQ